jgi:ribosomal protein S18 acetylase RimI-like enzyme
VATREVTRTYLEMTSPEQRVVFGLGDLDLRVERMHGCPASFFRYLYVEVGRAYHWVDRLSWSDEAFRGRLAEPGVQVFLMTHRAAPAGYYELEHHADGSVEIAYFGLLPEFLRRGFGKHLLDDAVVRAWSLRPTRVWLHTCSLDDVAALPNYVARGFLPYRRETYSIEA